MKKRQWLSACSVIALMAFFGAARVQAQDHDHDHGREMHDHFDDHDRAAARDWYRDHHDYVRHDEGRYWHHEWEPNIHEGFVLTPEMRRGIRPVPVELYRGFAPAPPGYRYVFIGGHVVLVDRGYRIHDVLHFEMNF